MKLERVGRELHPVLWANETFTAGLVENGVVRDAAKLGAVLREIFKKHGVTSAAVSVPEEQGYLVRFVVPSLASSDVGSGVEIQLEEHVPLQVAEAVYDFEIVEKVQDKDEYDVSVAVLPRVVVQGYLDAFDEAGVDVLSLEIEAQATARAVIDLSDPTTTLVVDFGHSRTGLAIASAGSVWFSSVVKLGGHNLTTVIAKQFGVDFAEAERMKDKTGLYQGEGSKDLYSVLLAPIAALKDEIVRYVLFWQSRAGDGKKEGSKIERVILSGGSSNLIGLADFLSHGLNLPVHIADPWRRAFSYDSFVPDLSLGEARAYSTAIGLALRQFDHERNRVHFL